MKISEVADVLAIPKLIDMVSELLATGYGEAVLKITVQNGKVKIVSLTKTETVSVDSLEQKELQ